MGFFNKLLGFRWSLYIVKDEKQLVYAMHENNPMKMVGYLMLYFANGKNPVEPWSLWLNFNHKHKAFKLNSEHFTPDGESVTRVLIQNIEALDPGWKVNSADPVFEDAITKKRLNINSYNTEQGHIDWEAKIQQMMDEIQENKPREVTFFSVMDEVFGKNN